MRANFSQEIMVDVYSAAVSCNGYSMDSWLKVYSTDSFVSLAEWVNALIEEFAKFCEIPIEEHEYVEGVGLLRLLHSRKDIDEMAKDDQMSLMAEDADTNRLFVRIEKFTL